MSADGYEQITIQGLPFRVPLRYAQGHTLTETEADILNSVLHEHLRNNFSKTVADGKDEGVELDALQSALDLYATAYQFGRRSGRARRDRSDPVTVAAMNYARDRVRAAVKERGLAPEDWPPAKISLAAKALLDSEPPGGPLMAAAQQRIETERELARASLAGVNAVIDEARETNF